MEASAELPGRKVVVVELVEQRELALERWEHEDGAVVLHEC